MKNNKIVDKLYVQLQKEIDRIELKNDLYTILFYSFRVSLILITGYITYLSGISDEEVSTSKQILILGTIASAMTAIDTLFRFDTKKDTYKLVLFDLRCLRSEYVHASNQERIDSDFEDKLFEKYKHVYSVTRTLIAAEKDKRDTPMN